MGEQNIMLITLAICTWNRAASLQQTLASVAAMEIPDGLAWEVLVVNNNCTDQTHDIVSGWKTTLPIRELFELRQGLSHARNLALEHASGEIIVWTDDDVRLDSAFLANYARAAAVYPDADFFGGPIIADFVSPPPSWLDRNLEVFADAYAVRAIAAEDVPIESVDALPYGANFALRRAALRGERFDTELGRSGTSMVGGEESDFLRRMLERGCRGVWVADARALHTVDAGRLTLSYLWRFYHGVGLMYARMTPKSETKSMRKLRKRYMRYRTTDLMHRLRRDHDWAVAYMKAAIVRGMIDGHPERQMRLQTESSVN